LLHEDSTLSGKVTVDAGGTTRWGIAEKSNPDLAPIAQLSLERALERYRKQYWLPAYAQLPSQHVADFVYDLGVNMSPCMAVKLLQRAVGSFEDGNLGPHTLEACATFSLSALLTVYATAARAHYRVLGQAQP